MIGRDNTKALRFLILEFDRFLSEGPGIMTDERLLDLARTRYAEIGAELNALDRPRVFEVVLVSQPSQSRIGIIKAIRNITNLGLKETKDISDVVMDGGMKAVATYPTREQAESAKAELVREGGQVAINETVS